MNKNQALAKVERYKKQAAAAYAEKQATVRAVVSSAEIILGATVSGYVSERFPTVAGIPTDAGLGIASLVGGIALEQEDLTALGLGMLAGYGRDMGRQVAQEGLGNVLSMAG